MFIQYEPDAKDPSGSSPSADADAQHDDKGTTVDPSSPAKPSEGDDKPDETLSDVVAKAQERAAKAATDDEAAEQPGAIPDKDSTQGADKKEPSDPNAKKDGKDEELPPFHEHPAWKRVIGEREEARTKLAEYEPLVKDQKSIIEFCRENRIEPQAYREGMQLMALLQNDPAKAYVELQKVVSALAPIAGERLPDDLQKRVDANDIDLEDAKEIARLRAARSLDAGKAKLTSEQQQQAETKRVQSEMTTALNGWGETKKKTDPDFARKFAMVNDRFLNFVRATNDRGESTYPVRTPADAIALIERAYTEVNKSLETFRPPPRQRRVLTSNGSGKTTEKEPTTLAEAIGRGLKERHGIDFGSNGE